MGRGAKRQTKRRAPGPSKVRTQLAELEADRGETFARSARIVAHLSNGRIAFDLETVRKYAGGKRVDALEAIEAGCRLGWCYQTADRAKDGRGWLYVGDLGTGRV